MRKEDTTYNGWTNWDTWNANLHLSNYDYMYSAMSTTTHDAARFISTGLELLTVDTYVDDWGNVKRKLYDYIDADAIDWDAILAAWNEE